MIQEVAVEVREYFPEDKPRRSNSKPQNYFIFVNGRNFLTFAPWSSDWEHVTLEWDGKIDNSKLEEEVTVQIPRALGVDLTPEAVLRSTRCLVAPNKPWLHLDLSSEADLNTFREAVNNPDNFFHFDVGKGKHGSKSMIRELYSLVTLGPGENNPAAFAFRHESFPEKYSGREIELLVKSSEIDSSLILWIAQHHADPVGLGAVEEISQAIRYLHAVRQE